MSASLDASSGHLSNDDRDAALQRLVSEAESAMKELSVSTDPEAKQRLNKQLKEKLAEAEQFKRVSKSISVSSTTFESSTPDKNLPSALYIRSTPLREPVSSRTLSKAEQILILKASFLHGTKFPPWTKEPVAEDFQLKNGEALHLDDFNFSLSSYQQMVLAGWERPETALSSMSPLGHPLSAEPTMDHVNTIDLVQDASTDCSVVASLCAGVARALRGHNRLLRPVLFPQDPVAGVPIMSQNGKYIVRLNFNGCYRRIIIDDRLPKSRTERVIHVLDRQNPMLLWPALVEKAYLKIRGGYDFPGSNSATDLWIITGWIPEQVFLQSADIDLDRFWTRALNAFAYGDILITMGTGKMSRKVEKQVGLAAEHDYAVLDMREVRGQRLMLVKNPWCEGTNWYRVPRRQSKVGLDTVGAQIDPEDRRFATQSPRDLLNANDQLSPGTFWMDINNAAQYFESIYLNWNPGLFTSRQDLHFSWDLSHEESRGIHASLHRNPQFCLSTESGGTIWLLLCRHLKNTDDAASHIDLSGYLALSASDQYGKRIKLAGRVIKKTDFVDSPQILLKLDNCEPGVQYTIVPLEQEMSSTTHTFTLSGFGSSNLILEHAAAAHPHTTQSSSSWTRDTAGGNAHSPSYSINPQFSIELTRPTKLTVLLETTREDLNVHVKMVHGKGQRVWTIQNRDIIFDSADYRRRCCVAQSKDVINAGKYTIICSTFEAQQLGGFNLLVESDHAVRVMALPREHAGRLQIDIRAAFAARSLKVMSKLTPKRLANIYFISKSVSNQSMSTPLRLSIEQGYGAQRRVLAASDDGEHINNLDQARLDGFDISPSMLRYGDLWLILERTCITDQAQQMEVVVNGFVDQIDALDFGTWTIADD